MSVESGVGWIPFALEALDWQWRNCGVHLEHPEYDLLPSEYFRRQIYGCFWFERDSAVAAIDQIGADNVLYETDFPHPTSMSPGPASVAQRPDDYLRSNFAHLDETSLRKILHDNASPDLPPRLTPARRPATSRTTRACARSAHALVACSQKIPHEESACGA